MKYRFSPALLGLGLVAASLLRATPLTETTAVQTRPDPAAPAITYLKAGTEPVAAATLLAPTPAGWMAVELPGPFEAYVVQNDITKTLDVRPGAVIHLEPKADSPVLTVAEKGDKTEITGLPRGKWMQISLQKKIVGYIRISPSAGASLPLIATAPASYAPSPAAPPPTAYGVTAAGKPAPMVDTGDGGTSALPRVFQGKFVSTHRPFAPKRPYDYQLNDDAGVRFAYVDVSKLLQTEQIDKYVGQTVVVAGTAKNVPSVGGIVLQAESLQLK